MEKDSKSSSLMQVTTNARRAVLGCAVFLVLVIIFQSVKDQLFTDPVLVPGQSDPYISVNNAFGKELPPLALESLSLAAGSSPEFGVENRFGEFPKALNVYKVAKPRERFGTVERAEEAARRLGFEGPYEKITDSDLQWKSSTRTLSFNKVLKRWNYDVDLENDLRAKIEHKIDPDTSVYEGGAKTVLSTVGVQLNELPSAVAEVYFMKLVGGELKEVNSPSAAQFVKVQLFWQREAATPKSTVLIDGKSSENQTPPVNALVYRDNPVTGSATVILSDTGNAIDHLYGFEVTEWEIDPISGVYTILTPEEAWDSIQSGKGMLRKMTSEDKSVFDLYEPLQVQRFITSNEEVSLGYFESNEYSEYQFPMYIFKGRAELIDGKEAEFTFFVDALKR